MTRCPLSTGPRVLLASLAAVLVLAAGAGQAAPARARGPIYLNRSYSFAERAADLVTRMTLAEKASQAISSRAPAIPRLGVRAYGWWNEALHGVSRLQLNPSGTTSMLLNTTAYPVDLALGSTWDPALVYGEASAISDEAREVAPGNALNLDFYAPTINLGRDPRWGRNDETYSEDPLLTATLASQFVNGFQGQDPSGRALRQGGGYLKAIATLKHFPVDNSEVDRLTGSSYVDERTLREYYTAPFGQIIGHSHPGAIMSAFRSINGIPSSASFHFTIQLARQTFGFGGYFSSDCDSVYYILAGHRWRPPGWSRPVNNTEARALANAAGQDLNCNVSSVSNLSYANLLPAAVGEGIPTPTGTYSVNDLDTSLVRLFTARMRLGEFDNIAREPWVAAARARLGHRPWTNSDANGAVTETPRRLGLARVVAERSMVLLRNATIGRRDGSTGPLLPLRVPRSGSYRVAVIGSLANPPNPGAMFLGAYSSVQSTAAVHNEITPYQGLRSAIQRINPGAQVDFLPGFTRGSNAVSLSTIDPAAVTAAAGYDTVIVYAATDRTTAQEDHDRTTLALPGTQAQLIQQVAARNPNTIAVLQTIGQVDLSGLIGVPALLWSSYTGQRTGDALAAVLLGQHNPSGHLPFTWYQSVGQLPPITSYAIRPARGLPGRTYMYFRGPISYPFGYGLSYTSFRDSGLRLNRRRVTASGSFQVSIQTKNTGRATGSHLVQVYIASPGSRSSSRPIRRLEGFRQIVLAPGQTRRVSFTIRASDLAFFDPGLNHFSVDNGRYWVAIANSAAPEDMELQAPITIAGRLAPVPSALSASPTMPGDRARGIQSRVSFPAGVAVAPNLTVTMNDAARYGDLGDGRTRALPRAATVHYTSDHPGVVGVAGDGRLRTLGGGVATVTARVRADGAGASTQFVIRVRDELDQLTVRTGGRASPPAGGKRSRGPARRTVVLAPVPGFQPDQLSYAMTVAAGKPAPRLTASSPDRRARVRIMQARGVPGAARVTVTGPDRVPLTYWVYFARPPRSDEFSGRAVGPQWTWIRRDPSTEALSAGSLVIAPEPGTLAGFADNGRNLLVQPALGNWTVTAKLSFNAPPSVEGQQAGILVYEDSENYLQLGWAYTAGAARLTETTEDSRSGTPITQTLVSGPTSPQIGHSVWLKMVRRGPRYTTFYSLDGSHYAKLYAVGASLVNTKVGLFAFSGGAPRTGLTVAFDWFHVRPQG
jgi:beta-glucosidase